MIAVNDPGNSAALTWSRAMTSLAAAAKDLADVAQRDRRSRGGGGSLSFQVGGVGHEPTYGPATGPHIVEKAGVCLLLR